MKKLTRRDFLKLSAAAHPVHVEAVHAVCHIPAARYRGPGDLLVDHELQHRHAIGRLVPQRGEYTFNRVNRYLPSA